MLLVEAGLIGLCAAVLGVVFGIVLGEALLDLVAQTVNDFYFRVTVTDVHVGPVSIAIGLLAGIAASLLAAAIPAWEATSYRPQLALTRSALERRARRALPLVTFTGLGMILAALIVIAVSGSSLGAGLTAVFLLILGLALFIPVLVRIAARLMAPLAGRIDGVSGRMAVAGISAGLSRTAVAIVALTVAVSATVGVSVMVDSFRDSVSEWLRATLRADLYAGMQRGPMDTDLVETVRRTEGVEAISTLRRVWLEDESGRTQLRVIEMAPGSYAGTEIFDTDPAAIWPRWETEDVVLVSEPYAFQHKVVAGDIISLPTDAGARDFEIAATFQSYDVNASAVLMSHATYGRHFEDTTIDSIGIYLAEGASEEAIIEVLGNLDAGEQTLRVISNADLRRRSLQIFDRTFVITDVLYWLALGVAFIGILSAMLALQLERAREFATLRALGMTPGQVGGLVTTQTGVIGLLAGLASIPLGIVMALVLIKVINRRAFGWQIDMTVAPEILLVAVMFAIGSAVLAGIYPAFRAGRSQPAIAMREE
jgi:putative ABC transport system permease protein